MSESQQKLLTERFKAAVLMFDNDQAGRECTRDVLGRLYDKMFVRAVKLEGKTQPDGLTEEQLGELLAFLR